MTFVHRTRRVGLVAGLLAMAAIAAGPVLAALVSVSIEDKTFKPAQITVAAGDTVIWTVTKEIGEPHSVKSGKPADDDAGKLFDSGIENLKDNGQTFQYTFAEAGTFDYFCAVHATEMTGQVVVTAAGGEAHEPIPAERKLAGAGILVVTLVVLFGAAWFWRRMNPA